MATILIAGTALGIDTKTAEDLTASWISAANAHNKAELRLLIDPVCLEGLSPVQSDFINDLIDRDCQRVIPTNATIKVEKLQGAPFTNMVTWKIKPTHQFEIKFNTDKYSSTSIIRFVRKIGDRWFIALPLPTPENLEQYRRKKESQQAASPRTRSPERRDEP